MPISSALLMGDYTVTAIQWNLLSIWSYLTSPLRAQFIILLKHSMKASLGPSSPCIIHTQRVSRSFVSELWPRKCWLSHRADGCLFWRACCVWSGWDVEDRWQVEPLQPTEWPISALLILRLASQSSITLTLLLQNQGSCYVIVLDLSLGDLLGSKRVLRKAWLKIKGNRRW